MLLRLHTHYPLSSLDICELLCQIKRFEAAWYTRSIFPRHKWSEKPQQYFLERVLAYFDEILWNNEIYWLGLGSAMRGIEMKVWQILSVSCCVYNIWPAGGPMRWGPGRDSSSRGRVWQCVTPGSLSNQAHSGWPTLRSGETSSNLPTTTDTVVTTVLNCGWKQQALAKGDSIRMRTKYYCNKWEL